MKILLWKNDWFDRIIFTGDYAILQSLRTTYDNGGFGPYVWYQEICKLELNEIRDENHKSDIVRVLMDMAGI